MDADEFRRIVDSSLSDIDVPVSEMPGDDTASPARKRMRTYMERMGAAGVTVTGIVTLPAELAGLLDQPGRRVLAQPAVHRGLADGHLLGLQGGSRDRQLSHDLSHQLSHELARDRQILSLSRELAAFPQVGG